eukprot:TRINITY_DN60994_c0_g1_i1.p1 TRINITY_DN60994_c0_g1~~TRINITY_DN60994_c0_g1_i1.p1  ORF type:complete len:245 (+),score=-6.01 TRINITY_DN60994_c0_g1_i1:332-1066(+)
MLFKCFKCIIEILLNYYFVCLVKKLLNLRNRPLKFFKKCKKSQPMFTFTTMLSLLHNIYVIILSFIDFCNLFVCFQFFLLRKNGGGLQIRILDWLNFQSCYENKGEVKLQTWGFVDDFIDSFYVQTFFPFMLSFFLQFKLHTKFQAGRQVFAEIKNQFSYSIIQKYGTCKFWQRLRFYQVANQSILNSVFIYGQSGLSCYYYNLQNSNKCSLGYEDYILVVVIIVLFRIKQNRKLSQRCYYSLV